MSNVHGTNTVFHIVASVGSLNISGDLNNVTLKWDKNNPDVTTFGDNTIQRISGLRDYSVDFAGIFNSGASTVNSFLVADMNASINTIFTFAPGGSISGSPIYSGCALISSYSITNPVNGPAAISFTLQAAAGSLTAACIA